MPKTILVYVWICGWWAMMPAQTEQTPSSEQKNAPAMGCCMLPGATQTTSSSYAGQEQRNIKALSEAEINNLLSGAGMGLAKAAELNHFPGPKHVLELAEPLHLTGEQLQQTQASFNKMSATATELGAQIVEAEKELDKLFASENPAPQTVETKVAEIAQLNGKLRFVHLNAHLEMKQILTAEQVAHYDRLRGYTNRENEVKY